MRWFVVFSSVLIGISDANEDVEGKKRIRTYDSVEDYCTVTDPFSEDSHLSTYFTSSSKFVMNFVFDLLRSIQFADCSLMLLVLQQMKFLSGSSLQISKISKNLWKAVNH